MLAAALGCGQGGSQKPAQDPNATGGTPSTESGSYDGCSQNPGPQTSTLSILDGSFEQDCISVAFGTALKFTNVGIRAHGVASLSGQGDSLDSGRMEPSEAYTHVFNVAGNLRIRCPYHTNERLWVVVR